MTNSWQTQNEPSDKTVARAIGEELRRRREAAGWSRGQFVALLPSGIGERTVLSYEHGTRHLTVIRLVELCRVLDVTAPTLLNNALQRARLDLTRLVLRVELKPVINDKRVKFRPMVQWAKNKLNKCPDGVAELPPSAVEELANFTGLTYEELTNFLAEFVPDTVSKDNTATDDTTTTKTADEEGEEL